MNRFHLVFIALIMVLAASIADAKNCKKGKPCGNTCIAKDKICHIGLAREASPPPPFFRNDKRNIVPQKRKNLSSTASTSQKEVTVKNSSNGDNFLTIQVKNIPLQHILQQIADQVSVEITVQGAMKTVVSADFADAEIADALRRIAPDFNSIVLYSYAKQKPEARISSIQLYAIAAQAGKDDIITLRPKPVK